MVLLGARPRGPSPPVRIPALDELASLSPKALADALRDCSVPFADAEALFALVLSRVAARAEVPDGLTALSNMLEALGDPGAALDAEAVQTLGELLQVHPFEVARLYARLSGASPDLAPNLLAEMAAQLVRFYAGADLRNLTVTYRLSKERARRTLSYIALFLRTVLPRAGCADPKALAAALAKRSHSSVGKALRACVLADPGLREELERGV